MAETETPFPNLSSPSTSVGPAEELRSSCPAPADFLEEVKTYDAGAQVGFWQGPRYRMTYRVFGQGPPLVLIPGIASTYRGYALTLNKLAERFRTVIYDYPGEHRGDGSRLSRISHDDLVDDLFGLIDHLNFGRVYLFGLSFGTTVTLKALHREPRRFPKAVVQGAFAHRGFTTAERVALRLGRLTPDRKLYFGAPHPELSGVIRRGEDASGEIYEERYASEVGRARVALGFVREICADQHTTRTFEIPAIGGFMLAHRTDEHLELFVEGKEAEFFASDEEYLEKMRYYLANEPARARVALAGHVRCMTSGYAYDDRMRAVMTALAIPA